uniref:Uncharacterized protein n=1 Tax=Trichogramma kaykai TaxID=54128 RepID=A0ABD2WTB5_9HYME
MEINQFLIEKLEKKKYFQTRRWHNIENQIDVFRGLEEILSLNISNLQDVHFFKQENNQFYGSVLTLNEIIIYRFFDSTIEQVASRELGGTSNSSKYDVKSNGDVLFVRKDTDVAIFKFFMEGNRYEIEQLQKITISDIKDVFFGRGSSKLLGISTPSKLYIFSWSGKKFTLLSILPFSTESVIPFQSKNNTSFVTLGEEKTRIFQSIRGQIVPVQNIQRKFHDGALVLLKDSSDTENLLALTNENQTILYHQIYDKIFTPFQELPAADQVDSIHNHGQTILLLLKNEIVKVYLYDGHRFVLRNHELFGVEKIEKEIINDMEYLLVKWVDNTWSLHRMQWGRISKPELHREILAWCLAVKDRTRTIPKSFLNLEKSIHIIGGRIRRIKAKKINGITIEKLDELKQNYINLMSHFTELNTHYTELRTVKSPVKVRTFRASKARINCSNNRCTAKNLAVKNECDFTNNLRKIHDHDVELDYVQVKEISGFPCPAAGIVFKDVNFTGLLNGISWINLLENTLKTSGNQIVTARHTFDKLITSSLFAQNIDIASSYTRQSVKTDAIYARELKLSDDTGLLPLDGKPVIMSGTLRTKKTVLAGPIELRGGIYGAGSKRYSPVVHFLDSTYQLNGDYALNDLHIIGSLQAKDVTRQKGQSLKEIIDLSISLDANVPVRLILSKEKTIWTNITVNTLPHWLMKTNSHPVQVTGWKIASKSVILSNALVSRLPLPKVETRICSVGAIAPGIRTTNLRVENITAKFILSDEVFGADELDAVLRDSVTSLKQVDMSKKHLAGRVFVKNVYIHDFEKNYGLQNSKFNWLTPKIIKGPLQLQNFDVNSMNITGTMKFYLPYKVKNLIVGKDFHVRKINDIFIDKLFREIISNDVKEFSGNITFGYLEVDELEAINSNIDLSFLHGNINIGNKVIETDLILENDITILNILSLSDNITTYMVEGSVKFKKEPTIKNLDGKSLPKYISETWVPCSPFPQPHKIHIADMNLTQSLNGSVLLNSPKFGYWKTLRNRVLSETDDQEIDVPVHLRKSHVPNIITKPGVILFCSDEKIHNLLYQTFTKDEKPIIRIPWTIGKLIVEGNIKLQGKLNNFNLTSDVARYDVEDNFVSGEKVVNELFVQNLTSENFGEWSKDALLQSKSRGYNVISGRKVFSTFKTRYINLEGDLMGKKIENCFLNGSDQVVQTPTFIEGYVTSTLLATQGLVNNINLTSFKHGCLKLCESAQNVKSKMVFSGNFNIVGNLIVQENFSKIIFNESNDEEHTASGLLPLITALEEIKQGYKKFWYAFELEKDIDMLGKNPILANFSHSNFQEMGDCVIVHFSSIVCNELEVYHLKVFINATNFLINKILSLDNGPIIIQVSAGSNSRITIHAYNSRTKFFDVVASIRSPGILQASVVAHEQIIWIVAQMRLSMMIVRFGPFGELKKYHLPASRFFLLDRVPASNELVLVRQDGMWKLDGLDGPRCEFHVSVKADHVESFSNSHDFFIRLISAGNVSLVLKAVYVGV